MVSLNLNICSNSWGKMCPDIKRRKLLVMFHSVCTFNKKMHPKCQPLQIMADGNSACENVHREGYGQASFPQGYCFGKLVWR